MKFEGIKEMIIILLEFNLMVAGAAFREEHIDKQFLADIIELNIRYLKLIDKDNEFLRELKIRRAALTKH